MAHGLMSCPHSVLVYDVPSSSGSLTAWNGGDSLKFLAPSPWPPSPIVHPPDPAQHPPRHLWTQLKPRVPFNQEIHVLPTPSHRLVPQFVFSGVWELLRCKTNNFYHNGGQPLSSSGLAEKTKHFCLYLLAVSGLTPRWMLLL